MTFWIHLSNGETTAVVAPDSTPVEKIIEMAKMNAMLIGEARIAPYLNGPMQIAVYPNGRKMVVYETASWRYYERVA